MFLYESVGYCGNLWNARVLSTRFLKHTIATNLHNIASDSNNAGTPHHAASTVILVAPVFSILSEASHVFLSFSFWNTLTEARPEQYPGKERDCTHLYTVMFCSRNSEKSRRLQSRSMSGVQWRF